MSIDDSTWFRSCGELNGSVIGPIRFILYMATADLIALVESLWSSPRLYADDTQIYGSCSPLHVDWFLSTVRPTNCVTAVAEWMQPDRLQLNDNKTEFMWCTTERRQHRLPAASPTPVSVSLLGHVHTSNIVEATFDFVATNNNNVERF